MSVSPSVKAIRRVLTVVKLGPPEGARVARDLHGLLEKRGLDVRYDQETARVLGRDDGFTRENLPADADLVIVAGGDGTLLSVARSAAPLGIPILGINFGTLGFLTELQRDEIPDGLARVLDGDFTIETRQTLRARYTARDGSQVEHALLNDAVITKSALARMLDLTVTVDSKWVATCTSDGLIVATPTGSTAYNLSAGGPILDPRVNAFVIAPICPHTMTYRPLVVPGDVSIEVALHRPDSEVYLTLDGQVGFPFSAEDQLVLDRHPCPVRLVRIVDRSFFEVLRHKLLWGAR